LLGSTFAAAARQSRLSSKSHRTIFLCPKHYATAVRAEHSTRVQRILIFQVQDSCNMTFARQELGVYCAVYYLCESGVSAHALSRFLCNECTCITVSVHVRRCRRYGCYVSCRCRQSFCRESLTAFKSSVIGQKKGFKNHTWCSWLCLSISAPSPGTEYFLTAAVTVWLLGPTVLPTAWVFARIIKHWDHV
jgi:hypothetical protein